MSAPKANGKPKPKQSCSRRGCTTTVHAKGLCAAHYRETRKRKPAVKPAAKPAEGRTGA